MNEGDSEGETVTGCQSGCDTTQKAALNSQCSCQIHDIPLNQLYVDPNYLIYTNINILRCGYIQYMLTIYTHTSTSTYMENIRLLYKC